MENQNRGRRLLILGNGFDLAHELPTRYTDFLDFCNIIMSLGLGNEKIVLQKIKSLQGEIDRLKWNDFVKKSIKDKLQKNVKIVSDLWQLLYNNIWYVFFDKIRSGNGIGSNWIDFEKEISNVIEFADRQDIDLDERAEDLLKFYPNEQPNSFGIKPQTYVYNAENKLTLFGDLTEKFLNPNSLISFFETLTVRKLRKDWYQHLENFIEALNLYFAYFIDSIPTDEIKASEKVAPIIAGIEKIDPDYVINFNYTHTYEKLYANANDKLEVFHIHGECTKDGKNNIVLGINQYWKTEEERQEHVNYAIFKKYVQRIRKRTGNRHHEILKELTIPIPSSENVERYVAPEIYVFGHSLDRTDKDILANFFNIEAEGMVSLGEIRKEDAKITVFYHDKETEGELIANMVSLIGEQKVLDKSERSKLSFMELSELR